MAEIVNNNKGVAVKGRWELYLPAGLRSHAYAVPGLECFDSGFLPPMAYRMGRWQMFLPGGLPLWTRAQECCNEPIYDPIPDDCVSLGISKHLNVSVGEVSNCVSAQCKHCRLTWDGTNTWLGSVALRTGTLSISLFRDITKPCDDEARWTWTVTCSEGSTIIEQPGIACNNPLLWNGFQGNFALCCGCSTDDTSDVNFFGYGNCSQFKLCRQISWTPSGLRRFAWAEKCVGQNFPCDANNCGNINCRLAVTVSGCAVNDGLYAAASDGAGNWTVPIPAEILTLSCGSDNIMHATFSCRMSTGSGSVLINDPENIDVVIPITVTTLPGEDPCCDGGFTIRITR